MKLPPTTVEVGLSLGSNLGDRLANLQNARERVAAIPGVKLLASSAVYETEPVDVPAEFADKPFLNAVIIVSCALDIRVLHKKLTAIEADMGRQRGPERNAPRPIDIDILYAGQECIADAGLAIPHPRWTKRRFVVEPLSDVRPDLKLPGEPQTVRDVLAAFPHESACDVCARNW